MLSAVMVLHRLNNEKHERFCAEYLRDLNATQAAIRAGYAESSARNQGSRLLQSAAVRDRIAQLARENNNERIADAVEVMVYLTQVLRGEIDANRGQVRAAELLAKRYGLLTNNNSTEKSTEGAVLVRIVDDI